MKGPIDASSSSVCLARSELVRWRADSRAVYQAGAVIAIAYRRRIATDHAFSDEKGCPQNLMNVAPATRTPAPNIATVTQRQKLACVASVFAIC